MNAEQKTLRDYLITSGWWSKEADFIAIIAAGMDWIAPLTYTNGKLTLSINIDKSAVEIAGEILPIANKKRQIKKLLK